MKKPIFKRLYYDLETSPNTVFSWNVGRKINLDYNNIIQERAIICVCWKYEGSNKVNSLSWKNGDDKLLVKQFAEILNSADEVIGHNSDNYDNKWLRTRCLYHGVSIIPDIQSVDTLKLSRRGFRFNSNRLDYIGKFLKVGKKSETGGFDLWKNIVLKNDRAALNKMIHYCKNDVLLLEKIHSKLKPYTTSRTHIGVFNGKSNHSCPECSGTHSISNGYRISACGTKKQRLHCQDCGKYYTIAIPKTEELV